MDKKSFAAGGLAALMVTAAVVPVSAKVGKVAKELEYRNISVSLDGKKLDLKDAQGNAVEPFMFDGTNYLPVRALAESLGLNVAWDGATTTVVLTTPDKNTASKTETAEPSTTEQKNALDKAKSYLSFSAFSRQGLIRQLEYEKFSTEAATWAVDNCGADWFEQAAKKAASYLKTSSFSRQGLIDQLLYEKFTQAEAEYGVSQNGY